MALASSSLTPNTVLVPDSSGASSVGFGSKKLVCTWSARRLRQTARARLSTYKSASSKANPPASSDQSLIQLPEVDSDAKAGTATGRAGFGNGALAGSVGAEAGITATGAAAGEAGGARLGTSFCGLAVLVLDALRMLRGLTAAGSLDKFGTGVAVAPSVLRGVVSASNRIMGLNTAAKSGLSSVLLFEVVV